MFANLNRPYTPNSYAYYSFPLVGGVTYATFNAPAPAGLSPFFETRVKNVVNTTAFPFMVEGDKGYHFDDLPAVSTSIPSGSNTDINTMKFRVVISTGCNVRAQINLLDLEAVLLAVIHMGCSPLGLVHRVAICFVALPHSG